MANLENAGTRSAESLAGQLKATANKTRNTALNVGTKLFAPLAVLAVLIVWELSAQAGNVSRLVLPAPTAILDAGREMVVSGDLFVQFGITLERMALGLSIGGSVGMLLGLIMGYSPRIRTMLDPLIAALHPVPKMTILPLLIFAIGLGTKTLVALVAISAFFTMLINSMAGVLQVKKTHIEVAKNYGANQRQILTRVILPGSFPSILAGLRLAANRALVGTVIGEMLLSREGLGSIVGLAWSTYRTDRLYVAVVVISVAGVVFSSGLKKLHEKLVPWDTHSN